MSLYSEVLGLVRRRGLFDGVRTVVVGVSGGPDSVCLLDLLVLMAERGDIDVAIHAAHMNHGLRGDEADADERFVREFAAARGVPIAIERRDIRALQERSGGSVEAVARCERYAFLLSSAAAVGAEAVAVGHSADDQAETVLHRLIRGAGLRGLRGMSLSRPLERGSAVRLVRPLLRTRRADILTFLSERGLPFREDSSNRDMAFVRNWIRHELLPLIEERCNPAFRESLVRLSCAVADAYDFVQQAADAEAPGRLHGSAVDLGAFQKLPPALVPLLVDRAIGRLSEGEHGQRQLDARHYEAVAELALSGERGARIELPGRITATRTERAIEFARRSPSERPTVFERRLTVPGVTSEPAAGLILTAELLDREALDLGAFLAVKSRYDEVLDYDALGAPLVLRSRRTGDAFHPLGSSGRRKVGKFLTDLKVPRGERDRVAIVAAGGDPIWVVGYRIDDRVKVTGSTRRVLRLSVREQEVQR